MKWPLEHTLAKTYYHIVNKKYVEWPDALYDILLYIVNKKYVEWPDALYRRILSKPSSYFTTMITTFYTENMTKR